MSNFTQINTQSIAHTRQLRDLKEKKCKKTKS